VGHRAGRQPARHTAAKTATRDTAACSYVGPIGGVLRVRVPWQNHTATTYTLRDQERRRREVKHEQPITRSGCRSLRKTPNGFKTALRPLPLYPEQGRGWTSPAASASASAVDEVETKSTG